jgi:hypothetical protein
MGIVQMGNDHNGGYFKDRKRFWYLQAVAAGNLVILNGPGTGSQTETVPASKDRPDMMNGHNSCNPMTVN